MSDEVCGYCGRANGWHMWGCPALFQGPGNAFLAMEETDEDIVLIAKLPEVE